jgi:hypothetical protein
MTDKPFDAEACDIGGHASVALTDVLLDYLCSILEASLFARLLHVSIMHLEFITFILHAQENSLDCSEISTSQKSSLTSAAVIKVTL